MPSRRLPIMGSALVLALALPIFLVAHWSLGGWAIAAVLWVVAHGLEPADRALRRRSRGCRSSRLLQVDRRARRPPRDIVANKHTGLAAMVTYALAYTCELGLSLASYFGADA